MNGRLSAAHAGRGDVVAVGWSLSTPSQAGSVAVVDATATVSLHCRDAGGDRPRTLVVHLPDRTARFSARLAGWLPTGNAASAAGYQASAILATTCPDGGPDTDATVSYRATLIASATTGPVAIRFHSVDAVSGPAPGRHRDDPIDCSSVTDNRPAMALCGAAWTDSVVVPAASARPPGRAVHAHPTSSAEAIRAGAPPATNRSGPIASSIKAAGGVIAAPSPAAILGPVPQVTPVIEGTEPASAPVAWPWLALILSLATTLVVVVGTRLRREADLRR